MDAEQKFAELKRSLLQSLETRHPVQAPSTELLMSSPRFAVVSISFPEVPTFLETISRDFNLQLLLILASYRLPYTLPTIPLRASSRNYQRFLYMGRSDYGARERRER